MVFFLCSAVRFRSFALQPEKDCETGRAVEVAFRRDHVGPLRKQAGEGERLKSDAEENDLKTI